MTTRERAHVVLDQPPEDQFMGHATIEETFSRYGHLMPGTRDQARELVNAYLGRMTA